MPAFDPDYESKPLAFFEPMLRQVFAREASHNGVVLP